MTAPTLWELTKQSTTSIGCFSAAYSADNPWSHPWIFDYWTYLGWIE